PERGREESELDADACRHRQPDVSTHARQRPPMKLACRRRHVSSSGGQDSLLRIRRKHLSFLAVAPLSDLRLTHLWHCWICLVIAVIDGNSENLISEK
ncbi:hypothetical protein TorRG33x02_267500, partial [Trema orientale]